MTSCWTSASWKGPSGSGVLVRAREGQLGPATTQVAAGLLSTTLCEYVSESCRCDILLRRPVEVTHINHLTVPTQNSDVGSPTTYPSTICASSASTRPSQLASPFGLRTHPVGKVSPTTPVRIAWASRAETRPSRFTSPCSTTGADTLCANIPRPCVAAMIV